MKMSVMINGVFVLVYIPLSPCAIISHDLSIPVGYHGSALHQKTIAIRIEGTHSLSLHLLCLRDQGVSFSFHDQNTPVQRNDVRFFFTLWSDADVALQKGFFASERLN